MKFTVTHYFEPSNYSVHLRCPAPVEDEDFLRWFIWYFDKQVVNIRAAHAQPLVERIFAVASDALWMETGEPGPQALAKIERSTKWRAWVEYPVPGMEAILAALPPRQGRTMEFTGEMRPLNGYSMIDLKVPFFTPTKIEPVVVESLMAFFSHGVGTHSSKELRFFLPIAVCAMCNWYKQNGIPGVFGIGKAGRHAADLVASVTAKTDAAKR